MGIGPQNTARVKQFVTVIEIPDLESMSLLSLRL